MIPATNPQAQEPRDLRLAALNPGVVEIARNAGWGERLGRDRLLFNARAAIERYRAMQAADAAAPQNRSPNAAIR